MNEIEKLRQALAQQLENMNLSLTDDSIVQAALQTEQKIDELFKKL